MSIDSQQSTLNAQQVQGIFSLYSTGRFNEVLDAETTIPREHRNDGMPFTLTGLTDSALVQPEPAIQNLRSAPPVTRCYGTNHWSRI